MTIFCILWTPLLYLFWHSLSRKNVGPGGIWALFLGSLVALAQFFFGNFIEPGGFGFSRWISAWVDIVVLPALLPLFLYLIFVLVSFFRVPSTPADFVNFALLWLIPSAALRAVGWSAAGDPVMLVLAPLLWTTLACGIPFFVDLLKAFPRWYVIIPSLLSVLLLPFLAATAWWALYSQRTSQGLLLTIFALSPLLAFVIVAWRRSDKRKVISDKRKVVISS